MLEGTTFPDPGLVSIGTVLVFAGFVLVLLATLVPLLRSGRLKGRGGGVILIGPFPIVFGSDKQSAKVFLVVAIVLVALLLGILLLQSLF